MENSELDNNTEIEKGFKRCSKCGRVLPLSEFYKRKSSKDGLYSYCKQCKKAMNAEYRQANKEALAQKKAIYNATHKEAIAQKKAEYRQANKEAIAQKQAEYRANNKEAIAQKQAEYRANNKEALAQKKAIYNATHKEEIKAYQAAYNAVHKDERKAYYAEWYQTHRDSELKRAADYRDPQKNPMGWARIKVGMYRQMDRQRGFDDKDTISVDYFINHIANAPCKYCGKQAYGLIGCNRVSNLEGHTIDNVVPCCKSCNSRENNRDMLERGLYWFQKKEKSKK